MKASSLTVSSLALAVIMGSCSGFGKKAQTEKKQAPNIIFILADDLGYGDLGVTFQNKRAQTNDRSEPCEFTPNLDTLASRGALLTNQYCAAPVCAPSRASILLGVSQGHANVRNNQFDKALDDNYTMASTLKKIGYSTAAIGKWGLQGDDRWNVNGSKWPAHPLKRGFEYFLGYMRHRDGHEHYPKEGIYRGKKEVWEDTTNIAASLDHCYTADLWTAAAKHWIVEHQQGQDSGKPFFMYLAYDTPHAVLELPAAPYPRGGGLHGGLQWLGEDGNMINTASGTPDSFVHPDYANATWDDDHDPSTAEVPWPDVYKRYATATRRIDEAVGDIVQLLKDLGISENTIIVFTSDNGPSRESYLPSQYKPNTPDFFNSFGPFDGIKRDCWEGGVRMPTIACWPGHIRSGEKIQTATASYDWAPTFLDAAGMPAPAKMDGQSLMPLLQDEGIPEPRDIYVEYFVDGKTPDYKEFSPLHRGRIRKQMQVIRTGTIVGVRYNIQSQDDDFEIYDVLEDPQELHNLASNPEMYSLQEWMKTRVLQMRRPNPTAPRPYDDALIPAVKNMNTSAGIRWSIFEGNFPWVPEVSSLDASRSGITPTPDAGLAENDNPAVLFFDGFLRIPEDNSYTFYLNTDGGAVMRIHDATLIDADHGYTPGKERQATINLKKGLHPFRIYYARRNAKNPMLNLQWSVSGKAKEKVPDDAYYHVE